MMRFSSQEGALFDATGKRALDDSLVAARPLV